MNTELRIVYRGKRTTKPSGSPGMAGPNKSGHDG
jgi:hypothetical protein